MLVAKTGYEPQLRLEAFYTGGAPARITRDGQRLVCPCADEVKASPGAVDDGGGASSASCLSLPTRANLSLQSNTHTHIHAHRSSTSRPAWSSARSRG